MGKALVGISGFSYPKWKGKFYPQGTSPEDFLAYYSNKLSTVEINSSFYAPPKESMVKSWGGKTPEGFVFSFKAPRLITHIMKLGKGAPEVARKFYGTVRHLGGKGGPILFQLPPFSRQDLKLLDTFLSETPEIKERVFEFRHDSWLQESTYKVLERNGTGFCIAETEDLKPSFQVTTGFSYFRLRKDSYTEKDVDDWSQRILESLGARDTFVYLRHDETGENALLAERLASSLNS